VRFVTKYEGGNLGEVGNVTTTMFAWYVMPNNQ